jgi:enhancer of polycomb-like protein
LQEVLSAVHRNNVLTRLTRGDKPAPPPPSAFIPTPDSTGVVDNYEELYPPNKWKDPATYVATSATVEENITNGIANGFTYYMDERDQEWLEKNNEEARGEGTSAQGALSVSGTRTSARSAKAKGKEPEAPQPVVISEDEFELVMGIFEKVTHERTEYLHHVCFALFIKLKYWRLNCGCYLGFGDRNGLSRILGIPGRVFRSVDAADVRDVYRAVLDTQSAGLA